jgi:hypothetical protein
MEERRLDSSRVIWAGVLATMVMTLLMMLCSAAGLPDSHLERIMASIFARDHLETGSGIWWLAMGEHFITGGVLLPFLFVGSFHHLHSLSPVTRGIAWGAMLWLVTETIMVPLAGLGLFGMSAASSFVLSLQSLVFHLCYGAVLGMAIGSKDDLYVEVPPQKVEDRHHVELHF